MTDLIFYLLLFLDLGDILPAGAGAPSSSDAGEPFLPGTAAQLSDVSKRESFPLQAVPCSPARHLEYRSHETGQMKYSFSRLFESI